MSQGPGAPSPPERGSESPSKAETMRDETKEVASAAAHRGGAIAKTAAEEGKNVAERARREGRDLLREGREQLQSQARNGQRQAARSLHDLADQLDTMAGKTDSPGVAAELTQQVSDRVHSVARWLDEREPGNLVEEVRRFARRHPGTFLAGAAIAGALVGRLTRGAIADERQSSRQDRETGPRAEQQPAAAPVSPPLPAEPAAAAPVAAPPPTAAPPPVTAPQPAQPATRPPVSNQVQR